MGYWDDVVPKQAYGDTVDDVFTFTVEYKTQPPEEEGIPLWALVLAGIGVGVGAGALLMRQRGE